MPPVLFSGQSQGSESRVRAKRSDLEKKLPPALSEGSRLQYKEVQVFSTESKRVRKGISRATFALHRARKNPDKGATRVKNHPKILPSSFKKVLLVITNGAQS